jgi:hypothetical protein
LLHYKENKIDRNKRSVSLMMIFVVFNNGKKKDFQFFKGRRMKRICLLV